MSNYQVNVPGVKIMGKVSAEQQTILTPEAIQFVAVLHRTFNPTRKALLKAREEREVRIRNGELPNFLKETEHIRNDPTWKAAVPAPGLVNRTVEITGPVDRKMVINALNSGADTFMADFEDSTSPTWDNCLNGQINMRDALLRTISFTSPEGKRYELKKDGKICTLLVRPRGWHLEEKHLLIDDEPCSGSIFDFGLYFFHNAFSSLKANQGPYFYLPKMESYLEARLWNNIFNLAQDTIGMQRGTIRGTVLIETILAGFEMEEIIYELREHSSGLNCGRWDYIFSFIKKFRFDPTFVLPDRSDVTMTSPFMDAYVRLLIKTCHKRGVHAMGGMAAQIPIKNDETANRAAMDKVKNDKLREVRAGHDGTWVAHPALVSVAQEIFKQNMHGPNQLYVSRDDVEITAADLLNTKVSGRITETGIRSNVSVGLAYIESWLRGVGCVPIHNLMEDAATAEISRSQLWQWAHHQVVTSEGQKVTPEYLTQILDEEVNKLHQQMGDKFFQSKFPKAKEYFKQQIVGKDYADFLTSLCYNDILTISSADSRL